MSNDKPVTVPFTWNGVPILAKPLSSPIASDQPWYAWLDYRPGVYHAPGFGPSPMAAAADVIQKVLAEVVEEEVEEEL